VTTPVHRGSPTTATILSAGLVASAELRDRHRDEPAGAAFRGHRRLLGEVVLRHGGRVVTAADSGVVAAFGAASPAVGAAVAMQVHVASAEAALRIGIATGDVSWDGDDCAGSAVDTAIRLRAEAKPAQILVSEIVRLLASDRPGARFEQVHHPRASAGPPGATETYAVEWEPLSELDIVGSAQPPPLPVAFGPPPTHGLVGRTAALRSLERAWELARAGAGRVVLVGGEPGSGKTRLATEFGRQVHGAGAAVLLGTCDDDLALPYQPWVQAVDQLVATLPLTTLTGDLALRLAPLGQLLVNGDRLAQDGAVTPSDPESARYRLYRAFGSALEVAADRWPTVVVLDDLHWAGAQTLALLRHVAHSGPPTGLLVVGTFRDTGDEITEPLAGCLADLRRLEAVTRLRLEGLDEPAVERFVSEAIGRPLDVSFRELAADLWLRSRGNAFYVIELWRHLVSSGAVTGAGDRWVVDDPAAASAVPDSVREAVDARLARLSPSARRTIEMAAVAGQRVGLDVMARALAVRPDDLDAPLGELASAGLLADATATAVVHQFEHSLVRDTVEAAIPPVPRRRAHLAVAHATEEIHAADRRPVLAELARHFAAAGTLAPLDKAVYYARRAAAQAVRSAAYDEAASHLEAVLELGPPAPERAQVLVDLAGVLLPLGRYARSRERSHEAFRLAVDLEAPELAAEAALLHEQATHLPGLPGGPAAELLRRAIELDGDGRGTTPLGVRLQAARGRALAIEGRVDDAREIIAFAVARAREIGDIEALLVGLKAVITSSDDPTHILATAEELEVLARGAGDLWSVAYGCTHQCRALIALGDVEAASGAHDRLRRATATGRYSMTELMTVHLETILALAAGDLTAAEEAADRALTLDANDESSFGAGVHGVQMFAIRRAQGRLEEVAPVVRLLAASSDPPPVWRPGLAALFAELGMLDEARALFGELAPDAFAGVARDALWPASLTFLAETCLALGDEERAGILSAELLRFRDRNLTAAFTMCFGPADRLLAGLAELCGRPDVADAHFRAALALAERSGSPLWTAEVLFDRAAALAARGDVRSAADLDQRAGAIAAQIGLARRRGHAPATGDARQRASDRLPGGLSSREAEVLRYVAAGLSNREIGERLFISQNTVANHVRAILRKTRCANRTEAATYAHRTGVVEL
jgi:class 3 adenylate cyclase/DNA-binding CsgD family transcriptional regulator/tetratricopeptide (TPR) repeat protein